jgi:GxxExxY protein
LFATRRAANSGYDDPQPNRRGRKSIRLFARSPECLNHHVNSSFPSLPSVTSFLLLHDGRYPLHPLFAKADRLSGEVIGAAIEVHRIMGPGLLESIYQRCLLYELDLRGIPVVQQQEVIIDYKGTVFTEALRFDLLVDGCLFVELKAVSEVAPIHKAQLFSYMKLLNVPVGLLFNFHETKLIDGISRLVLPGANQP